MFGSFGGSNVPSSYKGRQISFSSRDVMMGMVEPVAAGQSSRSSVRDRHLLSNSGRVHPSGIGSFGPLPVGNGGFGQVMRPEIMRENEDYRDGSSRSEQRAVRECRERDKCWGRVEYGRGRESNRQVEYRRDLVAASTKLELKPCFVIDQPRNSKEKVPEAYFGDKGVVDTWGNWQKNKIEDSLVEINNTQGNLGRYPRVVSRTTLMESEERVKKEQKRLMEKKKHEEEKLVELRNREEKLSREEDRLKEEELIKLKEYYNQQEIDRLRREERKIDQMKRDRVKREKELIEREKKLLNKNENHGDRRSDHHSIRDQLHPGGQVIHVGDFNLSEHGSVMDLLSSYLFKGVIVSSVGPKSGFIRSRQVYGDVYVHASHMDTEVRNFKGMVDRTVLFTLFDTEKKSLEARNVQLIDPAVARSVNDGQIESWDVDAAEGWLEDFVSGLRLGFGGADLKVRKRGRERHSLIGRKVKFELYVDSHQLKVEARNVKLVKDQDQVSSPESLLSEDCSRQINNNQMVGHQNSPNHSDSMSVSLSASEDLVNNNRDSYKTVSVRKTSIPRSRHQAGQHCRINVSTRLGLKKGFSKNDIHKSSRSREERGARNIHDWEVFTTVDQVGYNEDFVEDGHDLL